MKCKFITFAPGESIPVSKYLRNRKLRKYFNRETSAAIVCLAQLLGEETLPSNTPFYYASGLLKYEEYGLARLVEGSVDNDGNYSPKRFIKTGIAGISPLTSFKILPNMTLAFISIEHRLRGENAAIFVSAHSLITHAQLAPDDGYILMGAGEVTKTGEAAAGFALVDQSELGELPIPTADQTAIIYLRELSLGNS